MTLKDDLIAAKALIDTPEKWRKDNDASDPSACCAVIATNRAVVSSGPFFHYAAWQKLANALPREWVAANANRISKMYGGIKYEPGVYVGEYNDDPATSHADVLALFVRAIAAAEAAS